MIVMPDDNLLESIGANLRAARETRGVTREQLAERAEVDPQMIKRIEHGRANPALVVLSRLASALTISVSMMLGSNMAAEPLLPPPTAESEPFESETVGDTIASLRKDRHLSRRALARLVDVRNVTLTRYESASVDARILAIEPIAQALGITTDEFIREVEARQQQSDRARSGWHSPAEGVRCRCVSTAGRSQLWEWRLAPGATFDDEPSITTAEEIATAIRGEVIVSVAGTVHRLSRGGSAALPPGEVRRFSNGGQSTVRMLRFQVSK